MNLKKQQPNNEGANDMKRIKYLLVLILITTLLCSCNKTETSVNEPDYSAFTRKQNAESDIYGDANIKNNTDETPNTTSNPNPQGHDPEKEWPLELDFTGIASNKEVKLGNININRKIEYQYSYLVCYDADNDTTYYINYGNDNYIYELKDGKSSLLTDMEAICLQLWNNELYFLANNHKNQDMITGDIYCYNLSDKKLRLILETDANFLYIDSYGIYFTQLKPPQSGFIDTLKFTGYILDFGADTPQKVDYIQPVAYNEYLLYVSNEGIVLHNRETDEKILIAPKEYYYNHMSIYDQYLILTYESKICMLDLLNGDRKIFDFNDDKDLKNKGIYLMDYIIIDDVFYCISFGPVIYTCNLSTGELDIYSPLFGDIKSNPGIQALFTDGKSIYAIWQEYGHSRLVEICLTSEIQVIGLENLFEIKEMGK